MRNPNVTEPGSREPAAPKRVSPGRAVADLVDLARQRASDGDYWTPAEYRKAIAAYNRAVSTERRRHPDGAA